MHPPMIPSPPALCTAPLRLSERALSGSARARPDGLDVPPVHGLDQAAVELGVERGRPEHHLLPDRGLALRARGAPRSSQHHQHF